MGVRRVDVGGLGLAINESGAGGRPLLLVHGFTGGKEDFTELMEPLAADGWHAVAPDLRGHGASDSPAGQESYSVGWFVSDLIGLVDSLGWSEFALVGHSMGGAVAQRLALDHPERVSRLVLMSTFHGPLAIDPNLIALGAAIVASAGMVGLQQALSARRSDDPAAQAARERMERVRPGYGAWADAKLAACSPDMWTAMAPRFPRWPDTLAEVAALSMPTLVLCGSEDETMGAQCRALAAAVPGARLEIIEATRHNPQVEDPEATLDRLRPFLHNLDNTVGLATKEEHHS